MFFPSFLEDPPPFSLPRRFHCCDLTVGIYLTGGPASWDGDTIKMPGMQVCLPVVFGLRDGRCASGEFQGVRFFRVFTQAKGVEKRVFRVKRGLTLIRRSRWPGVNFLAMDFFFLGGVISISVIF